MSFEAMAWAVQKDCNTSAQKLVLLLLADHSNGYTGQCNPSHKRLAKACCMSVSSLKYQIKYLADEGYLTIEHKTSKGVSLANQYWLNIEGKDTVETDKTPPTPDYSRGSESDGGVGQILTGGGSDSGYKPVIEPIDQEQQQQQEIVVVPSEKKKTEIDLSKLRTDLHKPALAIIEILDSADQVEVITELTNRMRTNEIKNPIGYLSRLVKAHIDGSFTASKTSRLSPTSREIMVRDAARKKEEAIRMKEYIKQHLLKVNINPANAKL